MDSSAESPVRNDIELGPVTHWPTVYAAAGVAAAVLVGLAAIVALAAVQPAPPADAPQAVAAVVPAPPPRPVRPAVKSVEVVPAVPVVVLAAPEPTPVEPAKVVLPPVQAPAVVVPTAVTPIIRLSDPATSPAPPVLPSFQSTTDSDEHALLADLQARSRELDLNAVEGTAKKLLGKSGEEQGRGNPFRRREDPVTEVPTRQVAPILEVIAHRPDLAGLPISVGPDRRDVAITGKSLGHAPEPQARTETSPRASDPALQALGEVSRELRPFQSLRTSRSRRTPRITTASDDQEEEFNLSIEARLKAATITFLEEKKGWLKDVYSPALAQMLCVEEAPIRLQLTKMLAATEGNKASVALARQALFDMSPTVREAAVVALKGRPAKEYRQTLLDGFRHPWPPVAEHAAYALTTLDDRAAAKDLRTMADLPDPAAPSLNEQKRWVKADLVKVNHLRNCLLCHSPSSSPRDPVRGFVPKIGEALPPSYYAQPEGDFVRADVTYIRQDFSLIEAVKDPGLWPRMQRFDYVVRRRPLTDQELIDMVYSDAPSRNYPQREAVKFALEKLTAPEGRPVDKVGLGP